MTSLKIFEYDGDPPAPSRGGGNSRVDAKGGGPETTYTREFVISSSHNEKGLHEIAHSSSLSSFKSLLHVLAWRQESEGDYTTPTPSLSSSSPRMRVLSNLCRYYLIVAPKRVFSDLFLPVGYPNSVGKGYLQYQIYDSLQGLCSYLRGVVSTSAVLTAAGVGDAEATAMSAAVAWATKDGLGMVGGLLFSYCASSQFDSHVKEFRLFADVVNDVGLTLDMLAPHVGHGRVLYVSSIATVCKVMCGMAAGATKGSITQHFAIRGNMADLNAKESTQETLVSLMGMLLGIALARYLHHLEQTAIDDDDNVGKRMAALVSWSIFVFLTVVHVWANYVGVKLLHLRTLNRERATVALRGLIDACGDDLINAAELKRRRNGDSAENDALFRKILRPEDVSESLWASTRKLLYPGNLRLGTRLSETMQGMKSEDALHYLQTEFCDENYVVSVVGGGHRKHLAGAKVCISLRVGASDCDEMKAFLHAMLLRGYLDRLIRTDGNIQLSLSQDVKSLIAITHHRVDSLLRNRRDISHSGDMTGDTLKTGKGSTPDDSERSNSFLDKLSTRGWDVTGRLYLGYGRWRFQWESAKVD